ncbi:MAG: hypothetical protein IPP51_00705 [Bacteroidetes bacterium]|nr:hypothetical protein [Bacteroidota bacterium]
MDNILYEESLLMQEGVVAALKNGHNTFPQVMYDSRRKILLILGVPDNLIPDWLKDNHSLGSLMIWLVNFDAFADNRIGFVYATMRPLLNYLQAQTAESDLYEMLYSIQNILVKIATSGYNPVTDKEYKKLREELRKATVLKDILPEIVVLHRDLMEFWQFIKYKVPTYKGRRVHI